MGPEPKPFFNQEPWDLPVQVDDRIYTPPRLQKLQPNGMSWVRFHDLLTDIEVALVEAAARRGLSLRRRGKIDDDGHTGVDPQRQKRGNDCALEK